MLYGEVRVPGAEYGKHESRVLRQNGWVPGRIQTRLGEVIGVKLQYDDIKKIAFDRYLKNTVFTVILKDQEPIRCIVREMQVPFCLRPLPPYVWPSRPPPSPACPRVLPDCRSQTCCNAVG